MSHQDKQSAAEILTGEDNEEAFEDLTNLRRELDQIDEHIIAILSRRFSITDMVGALKAKHDLPSLDAEREAQMHERYAQLATDLNLKPEFISKIFKLIMQESVNNHEIIAENKNA
ncbi:MAG: chorismate mutase [Micrococcaceae bacterium]